MTSPRVRTVNVVHAIRPGAGRETAIDKRPVDGRVAVGELGLEGDRQCDAKHHGGPDKAVYAYATEDAAWWADRLDRDIPPSLIGDNLRTEGLDITGARIGEQWRIGGPGGVLVEVRMPRTPCENLSLRMGYPDFHKRFVAAGRVGAYLKVVEPGTVAAGDAVTIERRPDHDLTIGGYLDRPSAAVMRRALDTGIDLAEPVRRRARRIVARG
jgi:MOSC domain-containing protein YiiM